MFKEILAYLFMHHSDKEGYFEQILADMFYEKCEEKQIMVM